MSFFFDLFATFTTNAPLAITLWNASTWSLALGLIAAVPSIWFSYFEFRDIPRTSVAWSYGWAHLLANAVLMAGYIFVLVFRDPRIPAFEIAFVNFSLFLILGYSSYLAGKMVIRKRAELRLNSEIESKNPISKYEILRS